MRFLKIQDFMTGLVLILGITTVHLQGQEQENKKNDYSADCTASGCHDSYEKRAVVHDPVASKDCDSCHEETEEEDHKFRLIAEGALLCYECHDDYADDLPFLHGPVAAGACAVCHDVHASDHASLLTGKPAALCLECHTVLKARLTGGTYRHDPAIEDCIDCHDAHGAKNRMMLIADLPGLCLDCHDEILDVLNEATVKHDGSMTKDKYCCNCHEPHASNVEHILRREPMALCMSCHDEAQGSGNNRVPGLGTLLKQNPNRHGPIRDKNCSACHTGVHGGKKFRLLAGDYPSGFYTPFKQERYALCFGCHEPQLVRDERTESLTDFRNGDRNLHYLHVNRKKGRTCRACHETHASAKPWHLAESVPFGGSGWKIPINFEKTDSGGSCLCGCHKRYGYDRLSPVVNIPLKSGSDEGTGE